MYDARVTTKRIGIDCRFAGLHSGLGRYTRELVLHLLKRQDDIQYILFVRSKDEKWLEEAKNAEVVLADIKHYSLKEQIVFPRILGKANLDLLLSPHFNVPLRCPVPFIVTIHDLILHRYPNHASKLKQIAYKFLLQRVAVCADKIIAVSKFTEQELEDVYGKHIAEKTVVIREGVTPNFAPASEEEKERVREKYDLNRPFFLYVGNAKEHKNVPTLIEAFSGLDRKDIDLVLASNGEEAMKLELPSHVCRVTGISEEELVALYSGALAFVTASVYEGFCLPIAEAQACGCKVIAPNKSAIPEVAGENAVLVEPTVEGLRNAMAKVDEMSVSEPERLKWENVAEEAVRLFSY